MSSPKDNMVTQRLRQNLIHLRNKHNLSMSQCAEALGVTKDVINNWERLPARSSPGLFEIVRISQYYKISIEDLLLKELF